VTPRLDGGGVEQVTLDTARAVARAGAASLIASRGGALESEASEAGAELIRLPVHAKDPATILVNGVRLARLARRRQVSLIHVRSRAPAFSALLAGRLCGVPVVATYHGIYSARSAAKRWYNAVMTRGAVTFANSEFTRAHILQEHGLAMDRIAVVPEGVDVTRFDPAAVSAERIAVVRASWGLAPGDRRPVILQAARLTGWKGQTVAIDALAALPREGPVLILAGRAESAEHADNLRARVRAAELGDRVRLVGPAADMPAAWLAADLVVAPSTRPESFGRSVAEAGAMERLVLASPLGAVRETLAEGEAGWLVPAGEPTAWSQAIARALALPAVERREIGRRARDRIVERYSLEAMTRATFAAYGRIVEGAP
jgi:glycosyltransferase involved in cell wall biosynthesis